jgi:hypothetical protein
MLPAFLLVPARSSLHPRSRKSGTCCNRIDQLDSSFAFSMNIARKENFVCTNSSLCLITSIFMLTVGSDMTVEKAVQFIKGGFAFRAGRELGFKSPVWQKGFSEVRVLDAGAYFGITEYIRNNPVKRGLVSVAADFPHSSAHGGFELDPAPQGLKPSESFVADGMAKAIP